MKQPTLVWWWCLVATAAAAAVSVSAASESSLISSSTSRLPMSLSSVVSDLEAEGVSRLTCVAVLTSSSSSSRVGSVSLPLWLWNVALEEEAMEVGGTTAIGIRMESQEEEEQKVGLVVAPLSSSSSSLSSSSSSSPWTAAATIQACQSNVVQVVTASDLQSDNLFGTLAPALEAALALSSKAEDDEDDQDDQDQDDQDDASVLKWRLVVVLPGTVDFAKAQAQWEAAATRMLESLVVTNKKKDKAPRTLSSVFQSLTFVSAQEGVLVTATSSSSSSFVERTPVEAANDIVQAIATWNDAVAASATTTMTMTTNPLSISELTALRCFRTMLESKAESTLDTIRHLTGGASTTTTTPTLVPQYGNLANAALEQALEWVDARLETLGNSNNHKNNNNNNNNKSSPALAAALCLARQDFVHQVEAEIQVGLEQQVAELQKATYEQVQRGLSRLRLTPNLPSDMQAVVQDALAEYHKVVQGGLCPSSRSGSGSGSSLASRAGNMANSNKAAAYAAAMRRQLATSLQEYVSLRLAAAQADGKFRPLPRRGVQVGLHWLLPKPFGNDYRQEPWLAHTTRNLVYTPPDKLTEVDPDSVTRTASGAATASTAAAAKVGGADWRRAIIPHPPAADMTYVKMPNPQEEY